MRLQVVGAGLGRTGTTWWDSTEKTIVGTLRMEVPPDRLPVPEDPFPHENTSEEFRRNVERGRLDETASD